MTQCSVQITDVHVIIIGVYIINLNFRRASSHVKRIFVSFPPLGKHLSTRNYNIDTMMAPRLSKSKLYYLIRTMRRSRVQGNAHEKGGPKCHILGDGFFNLFFFFNISWLRVHTFSYRYSFRFN